MLIFDKKYLDLKTKIAEMGVNVTTMIQQTMTSLSHLDLELAREIIAKDTQINQLDIEINELCTRSLALYNPKAANLRSIITVLRLTVDLERIGDYCSNINKELLKIKTAGFISRYRELRQMGAIAESMLTDAITACFKNQSQLAIRVIIQDEKVNQLYKKLITSFLENDERNPDIIQQVISTMYIARCFERIADHATNIARSVNYLVTGDINRHLTVEELKGE